MKTLKNFVAGLKMKIKKNFFNVKDAGFPYDLSAKQQKEFVADNVAEMKLTEDYLVTYRGITRWQTL